MRIGRTIPPAAAPIRFREIVQGLLGTLQGEPSLERLKSELKALYQVRHVSLVSSGKAALVLILQSLRELKPDRYEVLIPAYTCYSVPSAIISAGLKVRLCDIDPSTLDFDFQALPKAIHESGRRLLAVVSVHLYGLLADVERVRGLVGSNAFVVEDAAQAMGCFDHITKAGTLGDAGFFSLGRGKAISSVQGGIILTSRKDVAAELESLINKIPGYSPGRTANLVFQAFGLMVLIRPSWFWLPKSIPSLRLGETLFDTTFPLLRMSPFQAGVLSRCREKLQGLKVSRRDRVKRWQAALQFLDDRALRAINPQKAHGTAFIRLPIKTHSAALAKRIVAESNRYGLGIMPGYPDSLNRVSFLQGPFSGKSFPGAEQTVETLLTLPIHPFVAQRDIQRAVDTLDKAIKKNDLL